MKNFEDFLKKIQAENPDSTIEDKCGFVVIRPGWSKKRLFHLCSSCGWKFAD